MSRDVRVLLLLDCSSMRPAGLRLALLCFVLCTPTPPRRARLALRQRVRLCESARVVLTSCRRTVNAGGLCQSRATHGLAANIGHDSPLPKDLFKANAVRRRSLSTASEGKMETWKPEEGAGEGGRRGRRGGKLLWSRVKHLNYTLSPKHPPRL